MSLNRAKTGSGELLAPINFILSAKYIEKSQSISPDYQDWFLRISPNLPYMYTLSGRQAVQGWQN